MYQLRCAVPVAYICARHVHQCILQLPTRRDVMTCWSGDADVQALYIDDDTSLIIRLNVADVALLYRLRDEILNGVFDRKLARAIGEAHILDFLHSASVLRQD